MLARMPVSAVKTSISGATSNVKQSVLQRLKAEINTKLRLNKHAQDTRP
jgi:hypothetical protein